MDNEEISFMQSQQSSAHNHSCYNKSAHEDRAVIQILPAPHPRPCQPFSTNGRSPPARDDFFHPLNPNSRRYQHIHVIPVNLRIIVNFSSPRCFFLFGFPRKNPVSSFIVCVVISVFILTL